MRWGGHGVATRFKRRVWSDDAERTIRGKALVAGVPAGHTARLCDDLAIYRGWKRGDGYPGFEELH